MGYFSQLNYFLAYQKQQALSVTYAVSYSALMVHGQPSFALDWQCHSRNRCEFEEKVQCHMEYEEQCTHEKQQKCSTHYRKECKPSYNYGENCQNIPEQKCHYETVPNCHKVPRQNCKTHKVPHCNKVPEQVGLFL